MTTASASGNVYDEVTLQARVEARAMLRWLFQPYDANHDYKKLEYGGVDFSDIHSALNRCRQPGRDARAAQDSLFEIRDALSRFLSAAESRAWFGHAGGGGLEIAQLSADAAVKSYGVKSIQESYAQNQSTRFSLDGLLYAHEQLNAACNAHKQPAPAARAGLAVHLR